MTSSHRRIGILLVLLGFESLLPAAVRAQPPVYLLQWGTPGSGVGQFNGPIGVATDAAGNVYVADAFNNRIQKFTGTGTYLTQWGSFGGGNGEFKYPGAVAIDADGNIYVSDHEGDRIQKFGDATAPALSTSWGRVKSRYR